MPAPCFKCVGKGWNDQSSSAMYEEEGLRERPLGRCHVNGASTLTILDKMERERSVLACKHAGHGVLSVTGIGGSALVVTRGRRRPASSSRGACAWSWQPDTVQPPYLTGERIRTRHRGMNGLRAPSETPMGMCPCSTQQHPIGI